MRATLLGRHRIILGALFVGVLTAAAAGLLLRHNGDSTSHPLDTDAPAALVPTVQPTITALPQPSPTPQIDRRDMLATRLTIPSLGIDSVVQPSLSIQETDHSPSGCPTSGQAEDSLTVPTDGIATPVDQLDGMENKAWIFGHSRWLGSPRPFLSLQDLSQGDELFIDGKDRQTGAMAVHLRFVVNGIYLTDIDSGGKLITATTPQEIPAKPEVILQTSVREYGRGTPWILNQQKVLGKATNLVEGDLNDPCKYLLLFVVATVAD